jgi:hypothetical protein
VATALSFNSAARAIIGLSFEQNARCSLFAS